MSKIHFWFAQFVQLLFLGRSKYLPESDFYLRQAFGQMLM